MPAKMAKINSGMVDFDITMRLNNTHQKLMQEAFDMCFKICEAFYESPETQEWMNRPGLHYDLIMLDSSMGECIYGIVHKFKAKHVIFVPAIVPYHWDAFGIVPESSSIPPTVQFMGLPPKPGEMGFSARFWSTLEPLIWRLGYSHYAGKIHSLIEEKMNITNLQSISDFEKNTSLVLVNTHFIEDYPSALPPLFVSYSGLWCSKAKIKEKKPLPDSLAKFVDHNDSDGFVYVSFGSAVVASAMPLELRNSFFQAFEAFPKLRFLWRWTGDIPKNKPDNVLLQTWFPQIDVLRHPKIKGFVTQCGRPSSQEALCYGVPMITIPIMG